MNKRGQIYLVAAIIVCMIAFVLVAKSNYIREQVLLLNFKDISSNYLTESPKVVNNALGSDTTTLQQVQSDLSGFTDNFLEKYAKNQDPNVGLIYIYNDKNGVIIQNSLNGETVKFLGSSGEELKVLLPTTETTGGSISITGTGLDSLAKVALCDQAQGKSYCILNGQSLSGEVTLKIGNPPINYNFNINPDSPELIVILKSQDQDTVKVDVSENNL